MGLRKRYGFRDLHSGLYFGCIKHSSRYVQRDRQLKLLDNTVARRNVDTVVAERKRWASWLSYMILVSGLLRR